MLPYLPTCVIGNVFEPFMILFMSELAAISFCAQSPNRSVHGGPARYKTASPDRELLCPKGLRKSADPPVRDRIGKHPPSNQSLTSASQGFCRNLAGKSKGQEGLGSVTIASNQVAIPTAHGCKTHPLNPAVSGFRNPRQLSTFTNSRTEPDFQRTASRSRLKLGQHDRFRQKLSTLLWSRRNYLCLGHIAIVINDHNHLSL
jgi:hypothetical protein